MHCTGQTSTHARSFVSIHASVMIAIPATVAAPCASSADRPDISNTATAYAGAMHHAFVFAKVAVVVGPWWEPGDPPERGARVELRLLSDEPHRGSESAAQ